jgi:hypothetical protein
MMSLRAAIKRLERRAWKETRAGEELREQAGESTTRV